MTSARLRKKRQNRKGPSVPRVIGANDNAAQIANDNRAEPIWTRDPGVKETPNQRIFRQMQRRALDEAPKAAPRYDPARLSPDQEKRARRASERLASDDPRKVTAARDELLKIAAEVAKRVETYTRANDDAEITALEEARGETVEVGGRNDPPGRLKVVTRDAMAIMWREKRISDLQYQGGLAFRKRYELLDPERCLSPLPLDGSRTATNPDRQMERALDIKKAMDDLLKFQRSVQIGDASMTGTAGRTIIDRIGRRVFVIREVAGKGASIRSLAAGGRERERLAQALSEALDVAVIHFRAGEEEGARRKIEVWRAGE